MGLTSKTCKGNAHLCGPAIHVEAGQLFVARQTRVFAGILGRRRRLVVHGGEVLGDALLVIGLVGLGRRGQRGLGMRRGIALELCWTLRRNGRSRNHSAL